MEIAAGILTSLASGASAAGSMIGSAAGAIGSALGGGTAIGAGSMVAGILSGSASLLQMAQLREAGAEKASALNLAADDTRTEIGMENVRQMERANTLKSSLLQAIGERDAAYAASGTDLTFGTPAVARDQAATEAERTLAIDDATTSSRIARLNERASSLRLQAAQARRSGNVMADIAGLEGLGRSAQRNLFGLEQLRGKGA